MCKWVVPAVEQSQCNENLLNPVAAYTSTLADDALEFWYSNQKTQSKAKPRSG